MSKVLRVRELCPHSSDQEYLRIIAREMHKLILNFLLWELLVAVMHATPSKNLFNLMCGIHQKFPFLRCLIDLDETSIAYLLLVYIQATIA